MSDHGIPAALHDALRQAANVETLLIASDYDGCLAPIVSRPEDAIPLPESIAALQHAATLTRTAVAVVSGRALADLTQRSGLAGSPITLVGSHGSEFDTGFDQPITADQQALLTRIAAEFDAIAADYPGVRVETKPVSAVLHVRNASGNDAAAALGRARSGPAQWAGVEATEGKAVIELAIIETSKGIALDLLRHNTGADCVVYLGDDVTDEKAFAHLSAPADVSIKVGAGQTHARYRVDDPAAVTTVLETLAGARGAALSQRSPGV